MRLLHDMFMERYLLNARAKKAEPHDCVSVAALCAFLGVRDCKIGATKVFLQDGMTRIGSCTL